ncbi:protein regulator of cytokinesis 1-like isoform X1 [Tachypleus tridentatus]|uniref:protein regulator of cytokinesis 1-like isoform X1 n=2 Tax=Tachypleus tridentatus TaxID=6853 RepID=UPI003FD17BEB
MASLDEEDCAVTTENRRIARKEIENQLLETFRSSLDQLFNIWDEIGIYGDQRQERTDVVMKHLRTLLEEMVEEEQCLRRRLLQNVESCGQEILRLCQELSTEPYEPEEGLSILQLEKDLRTKANELSREKHERLKALKHLREAEQKLCTSLGMPPHVFQSGSVIPPKEALKELEQHIAMLKEEKEKRLAKFLALKKQVIKLMEELETTPNTQLEREIVCEVESSFVLSQENIKAVKELHEELHFRYKENETLGADLREKLETIWNRLEVDKSDREIFMSMHHGFHPSTLRALQGELLRCEALKRQNIKNFVEKMRKELLDWWNKCFVGEEQRKYFTAFDSDDYDEDLLNLHDIEVQKMKQYYYKNEELFQKITKRQELWERMIDFEKKASDPNRFINRGGGLLQEEKERKKLLKELPKLEKELVDKITAWEEEEGKEFLVNGNNFHKFIENQWELQRIEKDKEKEERQKQRAKQLEEEILAGSRPTPAKRRHGGTTPSKTPSKMSRLGNPGCSTFLGMTPSSISKMHTRGASMAIFQSPVKKFPQSAGRTPRSTLKTPRRSPRFTPGKKTPYRQGRGVLTEKDDNQKDDTVSSTNSKTSTEDKCRSPVPSLVSVTSYSEFTNDLNKTVRSNYRSSMMSPNSTKKKVIGSKISPNWKNNKNKKMISPSRTRNQQKLTPARGRLGLPFLI